MPRNTQPPSAAIFDLGGVLIDWNPRHLYRKLFNDRAAMEEFLSTVCTPEWNSTLDAGYPIADAVAGLSTAYPDRAPLIEAYSERWGEMLNGPHDATVAILDELRDRDVHLYALTNWSAETFPIAIQRFEVLGWFEDILVSGSEGIVKPDSAIYDLAIERFEIEPHRTVFIDDAPANVAAAARAGFHAHHYRDAARLRAFLRRCALLDDQGGQGA
jgi:2-haloacid dehalogenase